MTAAPSPSRFSPEAGATGPGGRTGTSWPPAHAAETRETSGKSCGEQGTETRLECEYCISLSTLCSLPVRWWTARARPRRGPCPGSGGTWLSPCSRTSLDTWWRGSFRENKQASVYLDIGHRGKDTGSRLEARKQGWTLRRWRIRLKRCGSERRGGRRAW